MKLHTKPSWLSADVQVRIKSPPILLIKAEEKEDKVSNLTKVNMWRNP